MFQSSQQQARIRRTEVEGIRGERERNKAGKQASLVGVGGVACVGGREEEEEKPPLTEGKGKKTERGREADEKQPAQPEPNLAAAALPPPNPPNAVCFGRLQSIASLQPSSQHQGRIAAAAATTATGYCLFFFFFASVNNVLLTRYCELS